MRSICVCVDLVPNLFGSQCMGMRVIVITMECCICGYRFEAKPYYSSLVLDHQRNLIQHFPAHKVS